MRSALRVALPLAAGLLAAAGARAQVCTATASGVTFGTYDPVASSGTAITGTVTVICQATAAVGVSYTVQLGTGTSGSFAARSMGHGGSRLAYQLYTDATLTRVWGDGSGGTTVASDAIALAALATSRRSYTAYGRIAPRQVVSPGAYSDQIVVLVVY